MNVIIQNNVCIVQICMDPYPDFSVTAITIVRYKFKNNVKFKMIPPLFISTTR